MVHLVLKGPSQIEVKHQPEICEADSATKGGTLTRDLRRDVRVIKGLLLFLGTIYFKLTEGVQSQAALSAMSACCLCWDPSRCFNACAAKAGMLEMAGRIVRSSSNTESGPKPETLNLSVRAF